MEQIREDYVRRAVQVFKCPKGLVADKIDYLKHARGCTDAEITAALAEAVS